MSMARPLLLITVATASSCGSAPDVTVSEVAIEPEHVTSAAPEQRPAPKRTFQANVTAELCRSQPGCSVVGLDPVAPEATVFVATVYMGTEGNADGEAKNAFSRDEGTYSFPSSYGGCHRFVAWRVLRGEDHSVAERQKLFEVCNDGNGAAGMGEDAFTLGEGELMRESSGGSSWRWAVTTTISLDPLRLLKEESSGHWALGDNTSEQTWEWETLQGREIWETTRCSPTPGPSGPPIFARTLVPDVTLPPEFVTSAWKTISHGECAAKVDGQSAGFAIEGQEDPRSARLSVVMSSTSHLFVEVFDDVFTKRGAKVADTVVVHFAEDAPTYMTHCLEDPDAPDKIEVPFEGKVKRTGASAKGAIVEVVTPSGPTEPFRVHVFFAKPTPYFTLEYRDSDDGRRVARSIATSAFEPGNDATLGGTRRIQPRDIHCVPGGDELEIDRGPALDPYQPFIE